ncbi:unnamed protein product [Merluccius merluccius]
MNAASSKFELLFLPRRRSPCAAWDGSAPGLPCWAPGKRGCSRATAAQVAERGSASFLQEPGGAAEGPRTEKLGEELKARAAEMQRSAFRAVIVLVEHVPNTYMKMGDPFPSARAFKRCCVSNKWGLQKLICSYLTDVAQNVDAEIVHNVGSHCTNLSTQQPMQNYSFHQSETILFSAYAVLCESVYSGTVVIDIADTDAYVLAAVISQQLPRILCIKRKQETVFCLVAEEMADCILQLRCYTGCDANSGFYGEGI